VSWLVRDGWNNVLELLFPLVRAIAEDPVENRMSGFFNGP
jgi:hypothetical protein